MFTKPQLTLSRVFLTLFLRDKQSLFFSLVFPAILITVFALANNSEPVSYTHLTLPTTPYV